MKRPEFFGKLTKVGVIGILLQIATNIYIIKFISGWPKLVTLLLVFVLMLINYHEGWEKGFDFGEELTKDQFVAGLREIGVDVKEVKK